MNKETLENIIVNLQGLYKDLKCLQNISKEELLIPEMEGYRCDIENYLNVLFEQINHEINRYTSALKAPNSEGFLFAQKDELNSLNRIMRNLTVLEESPEDLEEELERGFDEDLDEDLKEDTISNKDEYEEEVIEYLNKGNNSNAYYGDYVKKEDRIKKQAEKENRTDNKKRKREDEIKEARIEGMVVGHEVLKYKENNVLVDEDYFNRDWNLDQSEDYIEVDSDYSVTEEELLDLTEDYEPEFMNLFEDIM